MNWSPSGFDNKEAAVSTLTLCTLYHRGKLVLIFNTSIYDP